MAVDGEFVSVSMTRSEACAKCRACIAGMAGREMLLTAQNLCGAKPGDSVRVELDDGDFIRSSLIMYGLPLALMLAGFFIGGALGNIFANINPEVLSFLLGMVFLAAGYLLIKNTEGARPKNRYRPKAVEIVNGTEERGR